MAEHYPHARVATFGPQVARKVGLWTLPTLMAAGEPDIGDKLRSGHRVGAAALNFPQMVNLRTDPYETSLDSQLYTRFFADQLWLFVPTQQAVGKWLMTFRELPPRQAVASFSVDGMIERMQQMMQMKAMQGPAK